MGRLINKATGQPEVFSPEQMPEKLYSQQYAPDPTEKYNVRAPSGGIEGVSGEALLTALGTGYEFESSREQSHRMAAEGREEVYGGVRGTVQGTVEAIGRGATLGGLDVGLRLLGEDPEALKARRQHMGRAGTVLEFAGAAIPVALSGGTAAPAAAGSTAARAGAAGLRGVLSKTPAALLGRGSSALGRKAAEVVGRSGLIGKAVAPVAGLAVTGTAEGAAIGGAEGLVNVAHTSEPITPELIASEIGSKALYGGLAGFVTGTAAGAVTQLSATAIAMRVAKAPLEKYAAKADELADVGGDLSRASRAELRQAEAYELNRLEKVAERERVDVVNDITRLNRTAQKAKVAETVAFDAADAADRAVANEIAKAEKRLLDVTSKPSRLAKNPRKAEAALEKTREALTRLVENPEKPLKKGFDQVANNLLSETKRVQDRLSAAYAPPTSPRLDQIEIARQAAKARRGPGIVKTLTDSDELFDAVSRNRSNGTKRLLRAVKAVTETADEVARVAPVLVSKALTAPKYGLVEENQKRRERIQQRHRDEVQLGHFRARAKELQTVTVPSPDGSLTMKPEARRAVSQGLAQYRQVDPLLADRLESTAVRRVEFLAAKLPRRPDIPNPILQSDRWRPSRYEVDKFARYAAAVEDPIAIIERTTQGVVTPEDVEVLREVYPEIYSDTREKLYTEIASARKTLPYKKRLALSIFFDTPVVPSMDPRILRTIQAAYAQEPGTEGGAQAPTAQPQFGSISKSIEEPTPAQERGG